jgi:hypothetical protein
MTQEKQNHHNEVENVILFFKRHGYGAGSGHTGIAVFTGMPLAHFQENGHPAMAQSHTRCEGIQNLQTVLESMAVCPALRSDCGVRFHCPDHRLYGRQSPHPALYQIEFHGSFHHLPDGHHRYDV